MLSSVHNLHFYKNKMGLKIIFVIGRGILFYIIYLKKYFGVFHRFQHFDDYLNSYVHLHITFSQMPDRKETKLLENLKFWTLWRVILEKKSILILLKISFRDYQILLIHLWLLWEIKKLIPFFVLLFSPRRVPDLPQSHIFDTEYENLW